MSRGFIVGLLWGLVVCTAGLAVLSLVVPSRTVQISQEVTGDAPAAAEPLAAAETDVEAAVASPVLDAPAELGVVAQTAVEAPPDAEPVVKPAPEPEPEPAANPSADPADQIVAEAAPEIAPDVSVGDGAELAMVTTPDTKTQAPGTEVAPLVPQSDLATPQAPVADLAPTPDAGTMPAPKQDKLLDPPTAPGAPEVESSPAVPVDDMAAADLPAAPDQPAVTEAPEAPVVPDASAEPEPAVEPPAEPEGEAALDPVTPALESQIDAPLNGAPTGPEVGLSNDVPGVTTDRLPRIGDAKIEAPAAEPSALQAAASGTPFEAYARDFSPAPGKPLFAILLQDIGVAGMARDDLLNLPFAVTFVIDPAAPDAAEAAKAYRLAGQEVVILAAGLPAGAKPEDLEQIFQAMANAMPETVALLDAAQGGLQENRILATQAIPILKEQGRGIVTYDRGLGAADQVAQREGLARATIFREIDAEGEDTPVIRRILDRAVFKAVQEGQVVVIGQTRPETVAAILEWMVEGRASTVQMAPITAVMRQN